MKASIKPILLGIVMAIPLLLTAQERGIKVGQRVPDWRLPDAGNKMFTLESWENKVLIINYVDPGQSDLNDDFNDFIKNVVERDRRIDPDKFDGFGIVDSRSTWMPNSAIRIVARRKARRYDATILFDYEGLLQDIWGMPKNSYTTIIVDRERVCRAIFRGEIPRSEWDNIVKLIIELTEGAPPRPSYPYLLRK